MHFLGIIWNPDQTLFTIGFIQIKYYNLLWIAAFALGWFIMKKIFMNEKKTLEQLDSLFIYTMLATMLGARLGHVFFYDWPYYSQHLTEILLPIRENPNESILFGIIKGYEFSGFAGLASHGAAIGIIIGMFLYCRKFDDMKPIWVLDRVVIPVAIGGVLIRLGNFFNSEINGKITSASSFMATKFIRDSDDMPLSRALAVTKQKSASKAYEMIEKDPAFAKVLEEIPYRHPAQLFEAMCYIPVFLALYYFYWKTDKKDQKGFLFGFFLVSLWTIRFFVEFLKKSQGGFETELGTSLSTGQWLSIPFVLIGFYFMFFFDKKKTA
jgi:prolipoprotein diacylglyceryl transferase